MPRPASAETARAGVLPFTHSAPEPIRPAPEVFPYGLGTNGTPRTWTGRVVALDEWRRLSDWERNGSTGKLGNGLTQQWEPAIPVS